MTMMRGPARAATTLCAFLLLAACDQAGTDDPPAPGDPVTAGKADQVGEVDPGVVFRFDADEPFETAAVFNVDVPTAWQLSDPIPPDGQQFDGLPDITLSEADVDGRGESRSLDIFNINDGQNPKIAFATRCVSWQAGAMGFGADVSVVDDQTGEGLVAIDVEFYDDAECNLDAALSDAHIEMDASDADGDGAWQMLVGEAEAPEGTRAARITLSAHDRFPPVGPPLGSGTRVRFDDVHLVPDAGGCQPDPFTLCLNQRRYAATVDFNVPDGNSGRARVVDFATDQSGLFTFFSPDNWEVMLKVLPACGINERTWVFAAATTTVEYTIRVEDTETGEVYEFAKTGNEAAPALTDTNAFDNCE